MDRRIVYPGQIPLETDLLFDARAGVQGLGRLAAGLFLGENAIEGLTVTPTQPATLAISVSAGSVYSMGPTDVTSYGTLGTDSRAICHQGILGAPVSLAITPPNVPGQSRVYLVQVSLQGRDTDATVLPYYNAANPDLAFSGPDNSGTPQNTVRASQAVVSLKAGTPAATGSTTLPAPDAGWLALAYVIVASGATSITNSNIVGVPDTRIHFGLQHLGASVRNIISSAGMVSNPLDQLQFAQALQNLFGGGGELGSQGWKRLAGGLIVQWGNSQTVTGANDIVAFRTTFPNECFGVVVSERNASGWYGQTFNPTFYGSNNHTQSGFGIYGTRLDAPTYRPATNCAFSYIALGR